MSALSALITPACLIDKQVFKRNVARVKNHVQNTGLAFRPHVKTLKSLSAAEYYAPVGTPITVSTLKEAAVFASAGYQDILYAVGITPNKFSLIDSLRQRAHQFTVSVDSLDGAQALVGFAEELRQPLNVVLEVDVDDHRAGIAPHGDDLLQCAALLSQAPRLHFRGIMAHAGASYGCFSPQAKQEMAQQECDQASLAAQRLRDAGFDCELVSVGSTPTVLADNIQYGLVTELRAGVYTTFDCVMAGLGVCNVSDIAMSVLTTVIGHQKTKGWVLVDAGWMGLSRDQGTASHMTDCGYGLVCNAQGELLDGWYVKSTNQEHGVICHRDGLAPDDAFAFGTQLRILPIHACSTGAQYEQYAVVNNEQQVEDVWSRVNGW